MSSSVDQIKSRINILELISSYMKLDKAGASWKGRCPFHNEKTPSFFVSPERGSYYCFGCQASGDIFTFVEEFEGLDFKGALKLLADRAGVLLETYSKETKEAKSEKERLYEAMEEATKFFENNLKDNTRESIQAREYLKSRGLEDKTVRDFRIGLAVLDWRKLFDYLKGKSFIDSEIERAGLAKKPEADLSKSNKPMYDRFRGRIMFPISDSSGRIIAFSGRILVDDGKSAKYLNSPETPIFSKNAVLYGIDKAKDAIRKNNFSILVEGQMDLILSHQAGYRNTIATSGTALSDSTVSKENVVSNLGLIRRLSSNIALAFDADKAGSSATIRAGKIALSLGMDVKVIDLPEGIDPADLISKTGSDAWREAIKNSKHIIEFLLNKAFKNYSKDPRKMGREIKEKIFPFVNAIESSIEKMHFLKKISDVSGIPQNALQDDFKKIEQELRYEKEETEIAKVNVERKLRKDPIERRLLGIAFWQESVKDKIIEPELIFKKLEKAKESFKDIREDLIYEAETFYSNSENLKKDVNEMLLSIEEEYLNEELIKEMIKLKNFKDNSEGKSLASHGAGKEEVEILKKINEINKRKEEIKNSR